MMLFAAYGNRPLAVCRNGQRLKSFLGHFRSLQGASCRQENKSAIEALPSFGEIPGLFSFSWN